MDVLGGASEGEEALPQCVLLSIKKASRSRVVGWLRRGFLGAV
jgi:hypothetical protein